MPSTRRKSFPPISACRSPRHDRAGPIREFRRVLAALSARAFQARNPPLAYRGNGRRQRPRGGGILLVQSRTFGGGGVRGLCAGLVRAFPCGKESADDMASPALVLARRLPDGASLARRRPQESASRCRDLAPLSSPANRPLTFI